MISKELLSEVLGVYPTTTEYNKDRYELSLYELSNQGEVIGGGAINIYELAWKCKEWAYDNGYEVVATKFKECVYPVVIHPLGTKRVVNFLKSETEPEAIFKACEWILEQKKKI